MTRHHTSLERDRGQAMVEFAMVVGLFLLIVGAIIQLGIILWSHNAVTEIARDTARWAVTQSASPCNTAPHRAEVAAKADEIAQGAALVGYTPGSWSSAPSITVMGYEGVGVDWTVPTGYFPTDCPPSDSGIAVFVTVRVSHEVPIFIPGLPLLGGVVAQPAEPNCGTSGFCVSSTTELRMEPKSP